MKPSLKDNTSGSAKPVNGPKPTNTKSVTYNLVGGGTKTIEYDPNAPCWFCELPVGSASMGGTVVCPSCDCGRHRDGREWTLREANSFYANFRKHQAERNVLVATDSQSQDKPLKSAKAKL